MKKKILSLLMALVMAAGLAAVPAETADAASNKGAVITANFNEVTWETSDWDNNRVDICASGAEKVSLKDATLSYTLYLSKGMFDKKITMGICNVLQVENCVNVHDENWEWFGQLRSTGNPVLAKGGPDTDFTGEYIVEATNIEGTKEADLSPYMSMEEKGDYVVLTVKDYPVGNGTVEWDEAQEKDVVTPLDLSKQYNINVSINCIPVNCTGGDAVIILDDVVVKSEGNVILEENFESSEDCGEKYAPGDDREKHPAIKGNAYTTSLLSLKSDKANIKVGKKAKIKATAVKGTKVTYKSNKPKVASVDAKGNIKGLKKGKAVISVSCCGKTLKYTVKVSK